jgi:outer membrane protein assembly factor BamB
MSPRRLRRQADRLSSFLLPIALTVLIALTADYLQAENWPRWRGPNGSAVTAALNLPVEWSTTQNVRWKVPILGEGSSSPIVWEDRIFLTASLDDGERRIVHCLNRDDGLILWSREIEDENPEITSALTGYAAPTPATDGRHVVAFFGNAGVVCYDFAGRQLWRRNLGEFESELGIGSSPIIHGDHAILVCDHDGNRFKTFDSFLIALDLTSGRTVWKTDRPGLFRSWSTPIVVPVAEGRQELIVNAQDELRGYDPETGKLLWQVRGMTGWVTPSPVFGHGLVFAASGKDGPTMAVRPGGRGDATEENIAWQHRRGAPYVCSPLLYGDHLYVHNEQGILTCHAAATGEILYRQRLDARFTASAAAGDGKIYVPNEAGTVYVIAAGDEFALLAANEMGEACLASPVFAAGRLLIRTARHLYCIEKTLPGGRGT